jgi:hypothetical protein
MTPHEIIQEWAKGCGNTMRGDPSECEPCTDGMLRALKEQGVDLQANLRRAEAVMAKQEKQRRTGFWARVWNR